MHLPEIGQRIRQARIARNLTQAELAATAGIARSTLNALENGVAKDLGIVKVLALARAVGLRLEAVPAPVRDHRNVLALATRAANVGFRTAIDEEAVLRALISGKPPAGGRPHLRRLLEDSPVELIRGLLEQVSGWTQPGRLARNVERLARDLGIPQERIDAWLKSG